MDRQIGNLLANSKVILNWGYATFSETFFTNSHYIYVKPSFSDCGKAIASITNWEHFIELQKDLLPKEDQVGEDDLGVVKTFKINLGNSSIKLVTKLISKHRIPTVFHEPYICHVLSERGINVPISIGILGPRVKGANHYFLMEQISNSYSLYQLYRKPARLKELLINEAGGQFTSDQLEDYSRNIVREFGAEVHRLFLTGIIHEELDLKNVCLSVQEKARFFFLDFERTRTITYEPNDDKLIESYKESIPRRLNRYSISEDQLQLFVDGYVSVVPEISLLKIKDCILQEQRKAKTSYIVISIDGYAGSGKTDLAKAIATLIPNTTIIETDMFMRYSRIERGLTQERFENHREWYDIELLENLLNEVMASSHGFKKKIHNLYDHKTGERKLVKQLNLERNTIIVVEGMYALAPEIRQYCALSILLLANPQDLFDRVYSRDIKDRLIPPDSIRKRFRIINGLPYEHFLKSNRNKADMIFDTTGKERKLSLLHVHYRLLPYFLNVERRGIGDTQKNEKKSKKGIDNLIPIQ